MQNSAPVTKTKIKFSLKTYFRINIKRGFKLRFMVLTGMIVSYIEKSRNVYGEFVKKTTLRSGAGRPGPAEMSSLCAPRYEDFYRVSRLNRSRILSDDEVRNVDFSSADGYLQATSFLDRLLIEKSQEISNVVNVGCGLDNISEWLARHHPKVHFVSNDTMQDLEEIHRDLLPSYKERTNWQCVSGYQHDLLREGKLKGDLFYTKSTMAGVYPSELEDYVALLSGVTKYVYFLESWDQPVNTINLFRLVRPEDVDVRKAFLSGSGFYYHNFIAIFQKYGFEVLTSELYPGPTYTLNILAKNRNL